MQAAMMSAMGDQGGDPRVPEFFFHSRLDAERRAKALAEAFAAAENECRAVADAASATLGELQRVSEGFHHDATYNHREAMRQHMSNVEWPEPDGVSDEMIRPDQRAVKFVVAISVTFELIRS